MWMIFPSSYFNLNKPDEELQREYDAAYHTGLFEIVLFGYDRWIQEGIFTLNCSPDTMQTAVYRGWMMTPGQYREFYQCLTEHHIRLVTTPEEYEQFHSFPKIYPLIKQDTAPILLFALHEMIDVNILKNKFKRFMVKDYVKSVKGTEFPMYFTHAVTQEAFDHWMEVFYQYRGKLLTGGICIKEYLDLKQYETHTNEYRVFYIHHQIASVSRNSGQTELAPAPPRSLLEKYTQLPGCFYTLDYAELVDGSWKILEAGDGSVSGLSDFQDDEAFYRALYHCLNTSEIIH